MKMWMLGGLCVVVVAGALAFRLWSKPRRWADMKQVTVDLDGVARVTVPESLRYDSQAIRRSGDTVAFVFQRVNGHHLNGMTSYAENLQISFAAPDLEAAAFEKAARGRFDNFFRATPLRSEQNGRVQLDLLEGDYSRDPVHEPIWCVRLTDLDARIVISWWGYKKTYTLEQARDNIQHIRGQLQPTGNLAAYLQRFRSYDTAGWQRVRDTNISAFNDALRDLDYPPAQPGAWTRHGELRYLIDNERPQQFHLVRPIAHIRLPDGPFKLLGPLTTFRFVRNSWWQDNQGLAGGKIPRDHLAELTKEMTDHEEIYFYRIHSFNLWRPLEGGSAGDLLRKALAGGIEMQQQFQAGKLIGGDAEP